MKAVRAFALAGLLALCIPAYASPQPRPAECHQCFPDDYEQQAQERQGTPPGSACTPCQPQTADEHPCADEEGFWGWVWPPIPSNWVMVIVTGAYAWFAYGQWKEIEKQANLAGKQVAGLERQAAIADRQLGELTRQADIAMAQFRAALRSGDAFIAAERARMAFEYITIRHTDEDGLAVDTVIDTLENELDVIDDNITIRLTYSLTNGGRTPARITAHYATLVCEDPEKLPADPEFPDAATPKILLVAEQLWQHVAAITLREPERSDIAAGRRALVLYGFVRYLDISDDEHTLRFCMISRPRGEWYSDAPLMKFGGPEAYNYAD